MEEFISEHGGVIVSGIISIFLLISVIMVIMAVGNIDAYIIDSIIGS